MQTRIDAPAGPPRLLAPFGSVRYLQDSLRTEKAYDDWVSMFVRWSGMRPPRDMGESEVKAFLTMLAAQRHVASSTHDQASSALLFLYRHVLGAQLPWRPSGCRSRMSISIAA